jgi:ribosomal protein S6
LLPAGSGRWKPKGGKMAIYESVFVLQSKVEEEAEEKVLSDIRGTYEKSKVKIHLELKWGKRPLPYLVKKEKEGIFYYFVWESDTGNVTQELHTRVRVTDSIIKSFHIRIDQDIKAMKKRYLSGRETNINGVVKGDGADKKDVDIKELIFHEPTATFLRDEY